MTEEGGEFDSFSAKEWLRLLAYGVAYYFIAVMPWALMVGSAFVMFDLWVFVVPLEVGFSLSFALAAPTYWPSRARRQKVTQRAFLILIGGIGFSAVAPVFPAALLFAPWIGFVAFAAYLLVEIGKPQIGRLSARTRAAAELVGGLLFAATLVLAAAVFGLCVMGANFEGGSL